MYWGGAAWVWACRCDITQNAGVDSTSPSGLNEVGEDVLDLLEFFISRYNHVNEATWWL